MDMSGMPKARQDAANDTTGTRTGATGRGETGDAGFAPPPAGSRSNGRTPRHTEWTRARMAGFLRELAASQSVSHAAKAVGMSRQSAYRLRDRLVNTPFALGWDVALEAGMHQLAHAMMDRAVNGVEVPHYYKGEIVGTSRHYDERLAIWMMGNPWKVGRRHIAREYSAEGWDRLLQRVETGPLDWVEGDEQPGFSPPAGNADKAEEREDRFYSRSYYAAVASDEINNPKRGR